MMKSVSRAAFLFILVCSILPNLAAQQLPRPSGFVNDFAGVLKAQDALAIGSLASAVKEKTGAEMALVTVMSFEPYASSIEEFSTALMKDWGVGERGKDNGVLFILAMAERESRIEVGYGLEGAIPDSAAGRILDTTVIPAFREGDYSGGLLKGCRTIAAYVAKEKGVNLENFDLPQIKETTGLRHSYGKVVFFIFLGLFFIFIFIAILLSRVLARRNRRSYEPGSLRAGSFGSASSFSRSVSNFNSSNKSFSGSSGSFKGFSGGSSGGGGASRKF